MMCILKANKAEKDFSHWLQYNMEKIDILYELYEKLCIENRQLRLAIIEKEAKARDLERIVHVMKEEIIKMKSDGFFQITTL